MRIVVTGATGNVGTSVLRALAADSRVDSIVGVARRLPEWQLDKVGIAGRDGESTPPLSCRWAVPDP